MSSNSENNVPDPNDIRGDKVLFPLYIAAGVGAALVLLAIIAVIILFCYMSNKRSKRRELARKSKAQQGNWNNPYGAGQYPNGQNPGGPYQIGVSNPGYSY